MPKARRNTSGHTGVKQHTSGGYTAYYGQEYLGYYPTIEEAIEARLAAEARGGCRPRRTVILSPPYPNDDGTWSVPLSNSDEVAIIDAEDVSLLEDYVWSLNKQGYVNSGLGKLHTVVAGPPPEDMVTDHIDGDPLNNRRSNLRFCTTQQNMCNKRPRNGKAISGVRQRDHGTWIAEIACEGKRYFLGTYNTEAEAIAARTAGEIILFGAFAPTQRQSTVRIIMGNTRPNDSNAV